MMMVEDVRDYGIAVADAQRLHDCWSELSADLAAQPALSGDEAHWFSNFSMSPRDEELIHWWNSRDLAEVVVREAVLDRRLPIWIRTAAGDALVDQHAITEVSHKTMRTGLYRTDDVRKGFLEFRPLWVKASDWQSFRREYLQARQGSGPALSVKKGAPLRYDWQSFTDQALDRLDYHGGFLTGDWSQGDLEREMTDWCSVAWQESVPSESTIRKYVAAANQEYLARQQADKSDA